MPVPLPFSILLPEMVIVGTVAFLAIVEIFSPETTRRYATAFNLGGLFAVGAALLGVTGKWGTVFQEMFSLDLFSIFFKWIFLLAALAVILMKREDPSRGGKIEFHLLLWSALLGLFFLVSATHFLLLFVALELLTLSLYILSAYRRDDLRSVEAGLKYLILGSLASAFLLYGISLIYAASGTLSFEALTQFAAQGEGRNWIFLGGALLVISALGFKVAAVPFHVWVPDVYQGAPTPVVAFLSVASKSAGFAALLRILFVALAPLEKERQILFSLFAAMTLLYGNLGALVQNNMKRLLGFSSIGHAGFLLAAVAARDVLGGEAILYYLLAYAVTNLTAFLAVSLVESHDRNSSGTLEDYRGLSRRSPLLAAGLFLAFLSLAGVPPLAGFFAKFLVLLAVAKSELFWLVFLGAVNVAISLYYYLNVLRMVYIEKPKVTTPIFVTPPSAFLLFGLMLGMVVMGIWQAPFYRWASLAALSLL